MNTKRPAEELGKHEKSPSGTATISAGAFCRKRHGPSTQSVGGRKQEEQVSGWRGTGEARPHLHLGCWLDCPHNTTMKWHISMAWLTW